MIRITIKAKAVINVPTAAYPTADIKKIIAAEKANAAVTVQAIKKAMSNLSDDVFVNVEVDEI